MVKVTNNETSHDYRHNHFLLLRTVHGAAENMHHDEISQERRIVRSSRQGFLQRVDACPDRKGRCRREAYRRVPQARQQAARRNTDDDSRIRPERHELAGRPPRGRVRVLEGSSSPVVFRSTFPPLSASASGPASTPTSRARSVFSKRSRRTVSATSPTRRARTEKKARMSTSCSIRIRR